MAWQVRAVDRFFDLLTDERGKIKHFRVQKDTLAILEIAKKIVKGPSGIDCFCLWVNHNGKKKKQILRSSNIEA